MRVLSFTFALLVVASSHVFGQATDKPAIVDKTLVLEPVAAPRPSLKFRLLPETGDLSSGNAALAYYRAMMPEAFSHRRTPEIDDKMERWRSAPLDKLPREEMRWLLDYTPLKECDAAARREHCDWEITERLRKEGFNLALGEMQSMRELNRLLLLRARLQLADGKFEDAVDTLQTCFAQARHVGHAPILICGLVGASCANSTLLELEELIQTPGAPNLYWALSALPTPLIDFRAGMEGEKIAVLATIPEMAIRDRALSRAEAGAMLARLMRIADLLQSGDGQKPLVRQFLLAAAAEGMAPEARKRLEAAGIPAALAKAMPAPQAVLLDWSSQYTEAYDERLRLTYLPYWQARSAMAKLEAEKKGLDIPVFGEIMPAVARASYASVRVDRHLALLRTVEALRLYAAAHDHQFPATLVELLETPLPVDPVTGRPFDYQVEGDKATLRAPAPTGETPSTSNSLGYVLVLKKKS